MRAAAPVRWSTVLEKDNRHKRGISGKWNQLQKEGARPPPPNPLWGKKKRGTQGTPRDREPPENRSPKRLGKTLPEKRKGKNADPADPKEGRGGPPTGIAKR